MVNRFISDWNESEYHNQSKAIKPGFSYTTAKNIWQKSPLHAKLLHPKLGGQDTESTKSMSFGQAVHTALLGKGQKFIKSEFSEFRTKESKDWRDAQESNGLIVLKPDEYNKIDEIKLYFEAQMRDFGLCGIFEDSQKEVIAEYEYEGVYCLSMMDTFNEKYAVIFDVKTCDNANPSILQRKIVDYSYDLQAALYTKAVEIIRPELTGRVRFIDLFIETEPPYALTPIELDNIWKVVAETKLNTTLEKWRDGIENNYWPAYVTDVLTIDCPAWESKKVLEAQ